MGILVLNSASNFVIILRKEVFHIKPSDASFKTKVFSSHRH